MFKVSFLSEYTKVKSNRHEIFCAKNPVKTVGDWLLSLLVLGSCHQPAASNKSVTDTTMQNLMRMMQGGANQREVVITDTAETVQISSLALLKMLKHG